MTAQPTSLRTLLSLAWPMVISRSAQVVIGVSDAWLVADLGTAALAATTAGAMNVFNVLIFPMGTAFIVSTFSSQLFGRGDLPGARRYGWYGLTLALITQILCLAALPMAAPLLGLLPYAPDLKDTMAAYIRIRLLTGGAAIGIEVLANYYGGLGNTRLPMIVNLSAMALNVVGNWVLIRGHFGAPALGVRGSALASAIATGIAFCVFFAIFLRDGRAVGRTPLVLRELGRMFRFGIPSGLNWFFEFFAFMFFVNVVVGGLGTTALAGMMAVMQINAVSFMPAFALASAGAILCGQAIGGGDRDAVPGIVKLTFRVAATYQGGIGLLYLLVPGTLFAPFVAAGVDGAELSRIGARMLMMSSAWQLCDAAATTLGEALRAAGDTAFTMWMRIAIAWLLFVPGSYWSVRHLGWGEVGALVAIVVYLSLLAAALFWRLRSGAWRNLRITDPRA